MAIKPRTGEGVLLPLRRSGSQHPWTWTSIILSFGYILSLCLSQFRLGPVSFLSFPELLLTLKDVPIHQLLIYSLFSLFLCAEGRAPRATFLAAFRSELCSQAYKTCQVTKQTNSVNCSLPCMTCSLHCYLILYLHLFTPLLPPFPSQN